MTLRQYIVLMLLGTLISAAGLGTIFSVVNPNEAGALIFIALYTLIFFFLLGVFSLLGLLARTTIIGKDQTTPLKVEISFRQGVLFAALVTAAIIMNAHSLLTWWNSVLIVSAVSLIETVFAGTAARR